MLPGLAAAPAQSQVKALVENWSVEKAGQYSGLGERVMQSDHACMKLVLEAHA